MVFLRPLIVGMLLQHLHYTICDSEKTYFIKATEDSPCATQPCLTLSEFIHNTTKDIKAGMVLLFGAGNHTLNSRKNFSNIEKCSMLSKDNNSIIACGKLVTGFTFKNVSMVTLTNITFIGCGNESISNAVLQISQVNINISTCTFLHSKGRIIEAAHASIITTNCIFKNSSAEVIVTKYNTTLLDVGSIYSHNTFPTKIGLGPALLYITASNAKFINSKFRENFVQIKMIQVMSGTLTLRQCEMAYNNGMRLVMSSNSSLQISDSKLTHNFALHSIFLIQVRFTNLSISSSTFAHNIAELRVNIFHVRESIVESYHALIITNNTSYQEFSYNLMDIRDSKVKFGKVHYSNNTGTIFFMHSKAIFTKRSKFQNHKQIKGAYSYGGAITSIASIIRFQSTTTFCDHDSQNKGGAVYAFESRIYANDETLFYNNKAGMSGGALYLDQSDFICQKKCTFTGNTAFKGGAIHAISSIITVGSDWNKYEQNSGVKSSLVFISNSADKGGAIYLEGNSKLRMPRGEECTYELVFDNNVAKFGGAIFVNDYTNVCNYSTCFIQAPSLLTLDPWNGRIKLNSTNGTNTIYGGLLDRCIAKRRYSGNHLRTWRGIDYIK